MSMTVEDTITLSKVYAPGLRPLRYRDRYRLRPASDRFFIDTLTVTGELLLVPASRRAEWQAFDAESEETAELLPVPSWARPVAELNHVEFEMPKEIFK